MKTSRYGQPGKKQTRLTVSEPQELMEFLLSKLPSQGRNNIKSLLTHRQVQVDAEVITRYNHLLQVGQEVTINWAIIRDEGPTTGLKILYEDPEIIIIDKPAGLLSIASDQEKLNTAYRQLRDYVSSTNPEDRIFIVHRLDRDTSGVMMFVKNETIKHELQDSWKETVIDRAYIAVVEGKIPEPQGTIKSWLKETKTKLMYSSSREGDGLEAITHFKVLQTSSKYSLLEIRLETGRKNQIRVHLQDIGHSIIGDKKYGSTTNPIGRLGLHAHILAFQHPTSGQIMRFETEIPKKFTSLF